MLLALLGGCMVTTRGLSNVVWVLLLANWLLEGRWHEKWQMAKESRLLHAVLALWLMYMSAFLLGNDPSKVFRMLETRLVILTVPLVILTTPPPKGQARNFILGFYITTVLVVSVIGGVRLATIPDLPYRNAVPFMSHIRFALNCCIVIILLVLNIKKRPTFPSPISSHFTFLVSHFTFLRWLVILWLVLYLLLIRSYTAFFMLAVVSLVLILCRYWSWKRFGVWMAVITLLVGAIVWGCHSYYSLSPQATASLPSTTANGRPYIHRQDGLVENGNYVNNYLCLEELHTEWPRHSSRPLDSVTADGYTLEPILIRYLNALGLPKDSSGVAQLTASQVADIEHGIPNPVYAHSWLGKRMLYVMLFEIENYRCYHAVTGFTMLQRIELWRATLRVIAKHPWWGCGMADMRDAMDAESRAIGSPLADSGFYPHNQYLSWMATFGIAGFAIVLLFFLRASPALRRQDPWLVTWMVVVLLSFLTEDTLGSIAGRLFCTWFLAFRKPIEMD